MEDIASSSTLLERSTYDSKLFQVDRETESNVPTTAKENRRTLSRSQAFRLDPTTNAQTTRRSHKKSDRTSLVPDHENVWHGSMKDVSNADAYNTHANTSVKENLPRTATQNLKSDEQRRNSHILDTKEKESLSDAELVEYFAERMRHLPLIYGFKSPERFDILQKAMSVNYDKSSDISSSHFHIHNHQSNHNPSEAVRHNAFKSKTKRKVLLPKIGPTTPSDHEHQMNTTGPVITSSFRSNTERFPKKFGKIPGPGMYDRVTEFPTKKQIGSFLSRGIYFSSSFT